MYVWSLAIFWNSQSYLYRVRIHVKIRNFTSISFIKYNNIIRIYPRLTQIYNCHFTSVFIFHLTVNIIARPSRNSVAATSIGTPSKATSYADAPCLLLIHRSVDASPAIAHQTMNYYFLGMRRRPVPLRTSLPLSLPCVKQRVLIDSPMSVTPRFLSFYKRILDKC